MTRHILPVTDTCGPVLQPMATPHLLRHAYHYTVERVFVTSAELINTSGKV